jgi:hypothetical protein
VFVACPSSFLSEPSKARKRAIPGGTVDKRWWPLGIASHCESLHSQPLEKVGRDSITISPAPSVHFEHLKVP